MTGPAGLPGPDPLLAALQQHLAGAGGAAGDPGAAATPPGLGLVAQLLEQRRARLERELQERGAAEDLPEDPREPPFEAAPPPYPDLRREVAFLRDRLADLAAALGACPACWGEHPGCRLCRGRGAPGFLPPEPEAFAALVLPAVRAYRRGHPSPAPHPAPHSGRDPRGDETP